jgi:hypothetical protein
MHSSHCRSLSRKSYATKSPPPPPPKKKGLQYSHDQMLTVEGGFIIYYIINVTYSLNTTPIFPFINKAASVTFHVGLL